MGAYIDKLKLLEQLNADYNGSWEAYASDEYIKAVRDEYEDVLDIICSMETIDIQPVKRGKWIITDDVEHFIAVCSECGRTEDSRCIKDMPYCHCGAKMR